jgi:hypothetical protein
MGQSRSAGRRKSSLGRIGESPSPCRCVPNGSRKTPTTLVFVGRRLTLGWSQYSPQNSCFWNRGGTLLRTTASPAQTKTDLPPDRLRSWRTQISGLPLMQFVYLLAQRSKRPRREHSLHRQPKVLSDLEGQFQRRSIVPALQKPDRLWIHAHGQCKGSAGQILFRPKDRNAIMKRHNAFINRFVSYKQYLIDAFFDVYLEGAPASELKTNSESPEAEYSR